ncbi:MAG TPA: response regulator [Terriglobia bacterium]|nr:response regulator [Terriglobia bacterium]
MERAVQETQSRLKPAYGKIQHKLLLVEEDRGDLRDYFGSLCTLGYKVVVAKSYTHAQALLERETFDLVIVGQGSPAFDGRQVVIRSLELNPHVPVIVVARALDIDCYLEAMELGAADYVEKGATPRDFMRALDSRLQVESAA